MALLDSGLRLNQVARKIGCSASSVVRWRDTRKREGDQGLKPKSAPGRPCYLTRKQKDRLVRLLLKGAIANGYRTELWTTARIAEVIETNFGIQ